MRKRLIRRYGRGHLHFITLSGYRRLPLFGILHFKRRRCDRA
jgi:hypothetical protein